ncbi:MAG: hypothetical protein KAV41_00430 [Candidatus Pacebacteria bacterium]|nr:hypothetical protein [Candidatus Paceibacterota bacterium]
MRKNREKEIVTNKFLEKTLKRSFDDFAVIMAKSFTFSDKRSDKLKKHFLSAKMSIEENFISVHQELAQIRQEINMLSMEVVRLKSKVDLISETEKEDTEVLFKDMEKLKIRVSELDKQVQFVKN